MTPERLQDVTLAERLRALHARLDAKLGAGFIDDIPGDELSAICEAAAALSGWLPIESAPKDGTRIILGRPDIDGDGGVSASGYWDDALEDGVDYMGHDGGFTDSDYQVFSPGRSFGNPDYRYGGSQPTHWQPLPATPPSEG